MAGEEYARVYSWGNDPERKIVAERYSDGNLFCLGNTVHCHPPLNGLGSNTCIQDAFNLAWKIANVHRGFAGAELLSTYSTERQPVGAGIVARANQAFRDHQPIWAALGMLETSLDERERALRELRTEMGQRYTGVGIFTADEGGAFVPAGKVAEEAVLYHEASTYPGCRLPHVRLNRSIPGEPVSTIDLAGHREFTPFTGVGGDAWREAAEIVAEKLRIPMLAHSIGFGVHQDWADLYFDRARMRGVQESGAVLVRPDRFVAWGADGVLGGVEECEGRLTGVMKSVLCLH
ncbi:FAD binding domain-containing protein [Aspergillus lucknowensis]|uniref:FAD binding domain-containing protein n=1 Tax=Aspergillus lucknowensis TaxID=176173 RepID=A0ABR4LDT8_9EURO